MSLQQKNKLEERLFALKSKVLGTETPFKSFAQLRRHQALCKGCPRCEIGEIALEVSSALPEGADENLGTKIFIDAFKKETSAFEVTDLIMACDEMVRVVGSHRELQDAVIVFRNAITKARAAIATKEIL